MRSSLRTRIAIALTFFSLLVAIPLILVGWWMNERTEQELWKAMLSAELADLKTSPPDARINAHGMLHSYVWRDDQRGGVPEEITALPAGLHDDVESRGKEWAVLIDQVGTQYTAVAIDISELESEEAYLSYWAILAGTVALVSLWLALNWLARRAVQPVTDLSAQLAGRSAVEMQPFHSRFDEQEISAVIVALNGFLDRIRDHADRERQFVETMSHELRTPLAVIQGAVEVLQQRQSHEPREIAAIARIRNTIKDVLQLSEVLLMLAMRDESALASEPLPVVQMLNKSLALFEIPLQQRGLSVHWIAADNLVVRGIRPLGEIVFNNLLRNCVDHAGSGVLSICCAEGKLVMSNTLRRESIERADVSRAARWTGNAGLGLELIERVCARLGWSLTVTAEENCFQATMTFGEK